MSNWKQITVTANSSLAYGNDVKLWLLSIVPQGARYCIFAKEDMDITNFANNQLIETFLVDNTLYGFVRYRGDSFVQMSIEAWTSAYALVVTQGDKYTIFYQ